MTADLPTIRARIAARDEARANPCCKPCRTVTWDTDVHGLTVDTHGPFRPCVKAEGHDGDCSPVGVRPVFGEDTVRALLAEIDRLNTRLADYDEREAERVGARAEAAAVAAYLRAAPHRHRHGGQVTTPRVSPATAAVLNELADAIERGDHHNEEG